jgi:hypothetical protein
MPIPMPVPSPPIDERTYADLVSETEALVKGYTKDPETGLGWDPGEEPDAGSALVRVFARMAKHVVDRLNRVPDKSFLAFLGLIGVEPSAPRSAEVPLTFLLSEGATAEPFIPARTRVAAEMPDGESREVTFETASDLTVSRASLASVVVLDPINDRYSDRTAIATGLLAGYYPVFKGTSQIDHSLYIHADAIFGLPSGTTVAVALTFSSAGLTAWKALHASVPAGVTWSYWDGTEWSSISAPQITTSGDVWKLSFDLPPDMVETTVNGRKDRYLRATLSSTPDDTVPQILGVTATAEVSVTGLQADQALSSGSLVDLSMDFHPMGEQPKFNSTFHVASAEVFSKAGARVELAFTTSEQHEAPDATEKEPNLLWETWTGSTWVRLGRSSNQNALEGTSSYDLTDGTYALTKGVTTATPSAAGVDGPGKVTFVLPSDVAPTDVKGTSTYWVRARLISGDYGTGSSLKETSDGVSILEDAYTPPVMQSIRLGYTYSVATTAACITANDHSFAEYAAGVGFTPFVGSSETEAALYLGYSRAFSERLTQLFIDVALIPSDIALEGPVRSPEAATPQVLWEYSTAAGWATLGADDGTRSFSQSGIVRFLGQADHTSRILFGQSLFWLRARLIKSGLESVLQAGRVLLNTVMATHTTTATDEILGSSNGMSNQKFKLTQTPVLVGEQIEVREQELPSLEEREAITKAAGDDAITILGGKDDFGNEAWVRWQAVPDFYTSGSTDRHYRIDRSTGAVTFGDGLHGMIPPRGARNIRARSYKTGGGAHANLAAGAVSKLQTTFPYVDSVTNYIAASGGADAGDLPSIRERGSRVLRHRHRAVAYEDFEDLAYEASSAVARAKVIPPTFDCVDLADNPTTLAQAGKVLLLLVPESSDRPPLPSLGLVRSVESYIKARSAPAVALQLSAPIWLEVTVTSMDIVPASYDGMDALRATVASALERFFDPLTGGTKGTGWDFGQIPHKSDIYRLLAPIRGVRRIRNLNFKLVHAGSETGAEFNEVTEAEILNRVLVYSGTHTVDILSPDEEG